MDGECIGCGEVGNWCRCDEPLEDKMAKLEMTAAPVTPAALEPHQPDYNPRAWEAYTFHELGMWVHLLTTRAGHRVQGPKRNKDLMDAKNYLEMMRAKLDVLLQAENLPA